MRGLLKRLAGVVVALGLLAMPVVLTVGASMPVWASVDVETSILPDNWEVMDILKFVLNVVVYGLGVAAVLGVVIAGLLYLTARDNEAQVKKAKTRLYEVVIGLVAWALMYVALNWLFPGGFNPSL